MLQAPVARKPANDDDEESDLPFCCNFLRLTDYQIRFYRCCLPSVPFFFSSWSFFTGLNILGLYLIECEDENEERGVASWVDFKTYKMINNDYVSCPIEKVNFSSIEAWRFKDGHTWLRLSSHCVEFFSFFTCQEDHFYRVFQAPFRDLGGRLVIDDQCGWLIK